MQPAVGGQADERLVANGGKADPRPRGTLGGQGVAGSGHQDQGLDNERVGQVAAGQVGVDRPEDQVDLARVQRVEQLRDQAGRHGETHPGIAVPELCQGRGQIQRAEDLGGADADLPAPHGAEFVQVGTGPVELIEDPAGPGQEQLARVSQRHPAGRALQQRRAKFGLEPPDLRGHRGLRDVQPLRSPAEAAVTHHRVEVDKLPQLHLLIIISD